MMTIDLPPLPPDARTVMLFDASKPASEKRFTVINLDGPTPTVVMHTTVAHGTGSDPDGDGVIERFSNAPNSNATSLGTYRVAEPYHSDKWNSIAYRLDGLDPTNSNARQRAVVFHPSRYVRDDYAGRSWGCPAISFDDFNTLRKVADLANAYIVIHTQEKTSHWLNYNLENPTCSMPTSMTASLQPQPVETPTPFAWSARSPVLNPMPQPQTTMETMPFTWPAWEDTPKLCAYASNWGLTPTRRTDMG